jgi:hypothetical protein
LAGVSWQKTVFYFHFSISCFSDINYLLGSIFYFFHNQKGRETMSMPKVTLLIGCIALLSGYSSCFSKTLAIQADDPYASGTFAVNRNAANRIDTVVFSNGLEFSFFTLMSNLAVYPTPPAYTGIIISDSSILKGSGFRSDPGNIWRTDTVYRQISPRVSYYSSRDTVWVQKSYYPSSLMHLDTIRNELCRTPTLPCTTSFGKWIYVAIQGEMPIMSAEHPVARYNNIMYFNARRNNIRLQVSGFGFSNGPGARFWANSIDSIIFKWSVDSLGNGIFKDLSSHAVTSLKARDIGNRRFSDNVITLRQQNFTGTGNAGTTHFNLQGKRITPYQPNIKTPAGMHVKGE